MIDLQKPIRAKDGREAKYLGELPDGRHAISFLRYDGRWDCIAFDIYRLEDSFINTPPAPPKLTGYCPVNIREGISWEGRTMKLCQADLKLYPDTISEYAIDLSTLTEKNFVRVGS